MLVQRRITSKFDADLWRVCLALLDRMASLIAFFRSAVMTCSLRYACWNKYDEYDSGDKQGTALTKRSAQTLA